MHVLKSTRILSCERKMLPQKVYTAYKTIVTLNFPVNNDCTHWDSGITGRGVVLVE